MFGENESESPRTPSPWIARCLSSTTPLELLTPPATPPLRDVDPKPGSPPSPLSPTSSPSSSSSSSVRSNPLLHRDDPEYRLLADELDSISLSRSKIEQPSASSFSLSQIPDSEMTRRPPPPLRVRVETVEIQQGFPPPSLAPEVDETGHIEYKLKLSLPTSLHRLERLRTQLKWRLVQGGGRAVYELGVLDHGELVGLESFEMHESLDTLERMLKGLGGGTISVTRVIKLINQGDHRGAELEMEEGEEEESPFEIARNVDQEESDSLDASSASANDPTTTTQPIDISSVEVGKAQKKGPTPFPSNRTQVEQAQLKRSKRDARRYKREQEALVAQQSECYPRVAASRRPGERGDGREEVHTITTTKRTPFNSHPSPVPSRQKPPRPPKPPRRRKVLAREERDEQRRLKREREREKDGEDCAGSGGGGGKPRLRLKPGEVRWVVEAVVEKKAGPTGTRRVSGNSLNRRKMPTKENDRNSVEEALFFGRDDSEEDQGSSETGHEESEDLENDREGEVKEEEGWNFLSFDLKDLSMNAKAAAAASS